MKFVRMVWLFEETEVSAGGFVCVVFQRTCPCLVGPCDGIKSFKTLDRDLLICFYSPKMKSLSKQTRL